MFQVRVFFGGFLHRAGLERDKVRLERLHWFPNAHIVKIVENHLSSLSKLVHTRSRDDQIGSIFDDIFLVSDFSLSLFERDRALWSRLVGQYQYFLLLPWCFGNRVFGHVPFDLWSYVSINSALIRSSTGKFKRWINSPRWKPLELNRETSNRKNRHKDENHRAL